MAFLGKGKKCDLIALAQEMQIDLPPDARVFEIKDLIIRSKDYEENFVRDYFHTIVEERLVKEEQEKISREKAEQEEKMAREQKEREEMNKFEMEKLRLQIEAQKIAQPSTNPSMPLNNQANFQFKRLLPDFDPKQDDFSLFINLFERQLKFLKIGKEHWVAYLLGVLPNDVAQLIAREPEEKAQDFDHIKAMLLHRFKLSADKFRHLFATQRKSPDKTWKDYHFEVRNYFEGWLAELKIKTFEQLKDLIILDQMKKRVPAEVKEHFLDVWCDWITPNDLVVKLDTYDNLRANKKEFKPLDTDTNRKFHPKQREQQKPNNQRKNQFSNFKLDNDQEHYRNPLSGVLSQSRRDPGVLSQSRRDPICDDRARGKNYDGFIENKTPLSCYGCGTPGFIKARCPNCSSIKKELAQVNSLQMYTCLTSQKQLALLDTSVYEAKGVLCIDTGASQSVGGELMYNFLRKRGEIFKEDQVTMSLADGHQITSKVLVAEVPIKVHERIFPTKLIFLPEAKGNRTLLGVDFLKKSAIVIDIFNSCWNFYDNPRQKFRFAKDVPIPKNSSEDVEINSFSLRKEEGETLNEAQRSELNTLLKEYEGIFHPGGEASPLIKHHINTGDHPPVSVPPYRISPSKKEVLKKELDDLLEKDIIEECESPYAAPVVLVPKPNGTVRLCIDYRKLNAVTVADKYPLPRMDDLMHAAKSTTYMSTIDLKSGYHQIEVNPADRDKTAFVCPFGTFRFKRMPFGLKNAPATFQRLMDNFRNGLPSVTMLSYLDDIIVLSSTFEQHVQDIRNVFNRLEKFKLSANREKCNFACSRVKYLGLWITQHGIEADPEKTAAIQEIPPPTNVKQTQSFLQTCSWYRKFIPNFSEIARPLSNLTKKNVDWKWGEREHHAFQTLKQCLISPPILTQANPLNPFVIRTDASSYALGAVLLQRQGTDEHPVEYASRLLTLAEKNYSTTEREALAVIWALEKFRGYIEGSSITVASDHQPLKWLMQLKSPSGRLARWALKLQSYDLNIEYIPGKCNIVADMLSRPSCQHAALSCEICTVSIDVPSRTPREIRDEQLKDEELAKIIHCFESSDKNVDYANWTERGYIMNQGVLYRYSPDSESEEAQLVVPIHERESILKEHHDAPTAGHYGADGTFNRIAKRYFWTGMRKFITEYVKNCIDCNRYKASNQKPAGLLQTPVPSQRFETLAIDLFGPLPESKDGKRWILIVEDVATKWVELFALPNATAKECAVTLLEEFLLRYGIPRRIISDNGTQFVSAVMQQLCWLLDIKQSLIPVYHPQANPVERKNRDLKPRLAIMVKDKHDSWSEKLPAIRFALNTSKCQSTGQTAAYLNYGRELRTTDDVTNDIRNVIANDNFVPEITPYLKRFANYTKQIKEIVEEQQDKRKQYADQKRKPAAQFMPGDHVYVTLHPLSNASRGRSAKFMPRRDGPYVVLSQRSPTSYEVASVDNPDVPLGVYHSSALKPYSQELVPPMHPLRKRGRPRKTLSAGSSPGRRRNQRGRL